MERGIQQEMYSTEQRDTSAPVGFLIGFGFGGGGGGNAGYHDREVDRKDGRIFFYFVG